ncbi:MAG: SurA N-terminal domain-containing protein [Alistipes sp.]|nr:SurA N-terminal domain-containing protein [Alistipes sp.]
MASLNTLRTKYGIVLSVVIALVLVAFILGDQLSMQNRKSDMPQDETVMTVNGEEVKASKYAQYQETFRDTNLSDDNKSDYAYQTAIYENFSAPALEAVGLGVAEADIKAYAKVFSQQVAEMYKMYGWPADQITMMVQNQWINSLPTIGLNLSYQKFNKVYSAGNYVNRLEVEDALRADKLTFDGSYVAVPYKAMPAVEVSQEEIDAYYETNKTENKNFGARTLRYVAFEIAPTEEDMAAVEEQVMAVNQAVAEAKGDSSAIKQAVRSIGGKVDTYKLYSSVDGKVQEAFKSSKQYGPVLEGETWKASYLVSDVTVPASYEFEVVEMGNIIEANELVETLKANGGDFTKLETAVDVATDTREMVKMNESDAKNFIGKKEGDIFTYTHNHKPAVVKITKVGDKERFALVAEVTKTVKASERTNNEIVKSVEKFMAEAGQSVETFNEAANAAHYQVLVTTANRNDYTPMQGRTRGVRGISNSRNIAVWAYDAEVGAMKNFHGENVIYVAMVAAIDENEFAPKNDMFIKTTLEREKQYEAIASQLAMGATIEGAESGKFAGVKFTDNNVDGRYEQALVGAIAATRQTGVETKVKGNAGAYVFVVESINGTIDPATIEEERTPDMTQRESAMGRVAIEALTSKAAVEDYRGEGQI